MKYLYVKPVFLWLSAITVMFLGACTSEVPGTSETAEAISFGVPQTRAAVEKPSDMEAFSVWGWCTDTETGGNPVSVFNKTRVAQASGWNYEGGTRYWIPGKTYSFYGVYPHGLENVEVTSDGITITNFDCSDTGENAIDLMTAVPNPISYNEGQTPESVKLAFGHRLVRVNFIVTSEGDAVNITNAKVYGMSYIGSLTAAGTWTLQEVSTSDNTPFKTEELSIPIGDTNTYYLFGGDMLLPPLTSLEGVVLEFDYQYTEGESRHSKILLNNQSVATQWEAGKRYNYNINIPLNAVSVEFTVEVKDWDNEYYTVTW